MPNHVERRIRRIGFVATRACGTDGVSLEIGKWTHVLEHLGYDCYFVCGRSDRPSDRSFLIAEADYQHPAIQEINHRVFGTRYRSSELSRQIRQLVESMKAQLYRAIEQFSLELLIAQNSLTIPLNIPLGAALLEVLIETGLPCIAHHHDFAWERERFLVNAVEDYIDSAFPPAIAKIDHVVINSLAGKEFGRRTGLTYRIIPNVMDFAHVPAPLDEYASDFRQTAGLSDDDILILQPTRVVARKGIEHTLEMVHRLNDPRCKVVISHSGSDEGDAYPRYIREYAEMLRVPVLFADRFISDQRGVTSAGTKQYAIWDVYPHADLVAYPSTFEGFGNAFLEAVYYRKPIFCNRYTIFRTDIEPCGFQAIVMDGFLTGEVVQQVRHVLEDAAFRQQMVDHNFAAARQFYSYERVEHELRSILDKPGPCPGGPDTN